MKYDRSVNRRAAKSRIQRAAETSPDRRGPDEAVVVRLVGGHRLDPLDEGSGVEQRDGCDALVDGRARQTFFLVRLLDEQRRAWAAEVEHDLGHDPLPDLGRARSPSCDELTRARHLGEVVAEDLGAHRPARARVEEQAEDLIGDRMLAEPGQEPSVSPGAVPLREAAAAPVRRTPRRRRRDWAIRARSRASPGRRGSPMKSL